VSSEYLPVAAQDRVDVTDITLDMVVALVIVSAAAIVVTEFFIGSAIVRALAKMTKPGSGIELAAH